MNPLCQQEERISSLWPIWDGWVWDKIRGQLLSKAFVLDTAYIKRQPDIDSFDIATQLRKNPSVCSYRQFPVIQVKFFLGGTGLRTFKFHQKHAESTFFVIWNIKITGSFWWGQTQPFLGAPNLWTLETFCVNESFLIKWVISRIVVDFVLNLTATTYI